MKFDFKTMKEKILHKSSDENELPKEVKKASNNKLNYICIGVLIVGIVLTFTSYFLYKDMYISLIVIMIFIFISSIIYYLSTLKINKLNNDPELKIKKQFVCDILSNYLMTNQYVDSLKYAYEHMDTSSFKDNLSKIDFQDVNSIKTFSLKSENDEYFAFDKQLEEVILLPLSLKGTKQLECFIKQAKMFLDIKLEKNASEAIVNVNLIIFACFYITFILMMVL